jgi:8-oxo-dGTP diphosphatase
MDTIKVVCGIIYDGDKVFLCRRNPNKSLGGYWEFPGGKIEMGETPQSALERELKEELEMQVTVNDFFKTEVHQYEKFRIELISYKCKFINSTYRMIDHDAYEWVKVNDLNFWNLAPADIPIANELIKNESDNPLSSF